VAVPYFDLKEQYEGIREEVLAALDRVCANAQFVLGEEVQRFEEEFAEYCDTAHCVALNSGTSALHLALLAAGIGPGDEVITAPNSFIATAAAISYTGADPVFADVLPTTANIDPTAVERAITSRTRAIVPVHLHGRPADLGPILDLGERHGITVIEDACQAQGATYHGRHVGGLGQSGVFSFYPAKNLGAYGEGGALVTNDAAVADFARTMRDQGQSAKYLHSAIGFNYRMEGFQGAVLRIKLRRLEEWTERRLEIAVQYRDLLSDLDVDLPEDDPESRCAYHIFAIYVDDRDSVQTGLGERAIGTGIHYPVPIHLQEAYSHLDLPRGSFPVSERACDRELSLPIFPEMTSEQAGEVAAALAEVAGTRGRNAEVRRSGSDAPNVSWTTAGSQGE
jgi:dTDP-4-amino-4,6-dideoxygalactose transaminase